MMQGTDPSTLELRDIHLPDSVLWWPPAPGWWIVLLLILIIAYAVYFFIRKRQKKRLSAIYLAKQELSQIEYEYNKNQDKSFLVKEVSALIRRVSISLFNRNESASLTGREWLVFLDKLNGDTAFSEGVGKVLVEAPYQPKPDFDDKKLLSLISTWLDSAQSNTGNKGNQK
jgi:Domain of unknown function (DUF4381)